jgi:hypothetical protein
MRQVPPAMVMARGWAPAHAAAAAGDAEPAGERAAEVLAAGSAKVS